MNDYLMIRRFAQDMTRFKDTWRGDCPFCRGKNTFKATQEDGELKYICYKLGCIAKGVYVEGMSAQEILNRLRGDEDKQLIELETMTIPAHVVRPTEEHDKLHKFVRRWGLNTNDLYYDLAQERVVFPIYHKGRLIDAVGRSVGNRVQPKWYRYSGQANYYMIGKGDTLVVVEDVLSAMIVTQELVGITAMAILGTSINDKHIEQIGEFDHIIVALDPDAADKTIQFRRDIELWTGVKATALRLSDDLKYREDEDLEKLRELL